ncbi:MAG: DUF4272 domain-containing protein [Janthinobacterium lividum]
MSRIFLVALALAFCACQPDTSSKVKNRTTVPVENITPTADQQARRAQSEAYCQAHHVPIYANPTALFVDPEAQVSLRTQDEVVDRALALCYLGLQSEGLEPEHLAEMSQDYRIASKLTPQEQLYATAKQPTEQQKIDANWRYESLHTLLWALGFVNELVYPDQMCNVAADVKIIHELTETQFRQKARLRNKKEILDQADLILRLDWACVSARVKNEAAPANMDKGVVFERHHSLNWLIQYAEQDWDDVTTDT